jgi:hypothetical protein
VGSPDSGLCPAYRAEWGARNVGPHILLPHIKFVVEMNALGSSHFLLSGLVGMEVEGSGPDPCGS